MNRRVLFYGIVLCLCLFPPSVTYAEVPDWVLDLIREATTNPDELAYTIRTVDSDCPITHADVNEIVESELIRSRIKPCLVYCDIDDSEYLFLALDIDCLDRGSLNPVFFNRFVFRREVV